MLKDKYHLKSAISKRRRGKNQNIRVFLEFFNNFYNGLRMKRKPNFYHDMCDPYGFALICEDYKNDKLIYDVELSCKEVFEGQGVDECIDIPTYQGQFSFIEILDFLYIGFWFDYRKAIDVYNNQHDALSIFNQIINGNGFIFNRARPDLKKSQENSKSAFESIVSLDENLPINIPHVWHLCDGMIAPFIIMKYSPSIRVQRADCHGFGEGIFLISDNKIIDCLKINDTWFVDLPLEDRIQFAYKCTDYEVAQYGKAWSWRSALEVGKMLGCDYLNGLLVRGSRENFFNNRWFNWSRNSIIYCKKVNGKLVSKSRGRIQPEFYNIDGDEAIINPFEERTYERVYLDDWDINEFMKIKELKNGYKI